MVQWLLLDRIDAESARAAVGCEDDLVAFACADEAQAALALAELAGAGADVALDAPVVEAVPVLRADGRGRRGRPARSGRVGAGGRGWERLGGRKRRQRSGT